VEKEEILKMKAGEKLDRLVATEVMGEPIPEFTPPNALELQLAGSPVKSPQGNWVSRCKYSEGDIPTWRPLPYSRDIASAWQVKEKLKVGDNETWFAFCLQVEDICGGDEPVLYELNAEIICKAALIAKYSQ